MTTSALNIAEAAHLLAFADDEHLMGQQHTEWIGTAPFLEEDLAFSSIAQDELGHAAAIYELLGDPDHLAFTREPAEYRSCSLVELPCAEWEVAIARHWLYDLAERHRWETLAPNARGELAGIVARARREEEYHRVHVGTIVETLRRSGTGVRQRFDDAALSLLPDADALWTTADDEAALVDSGFLAESAQVMQTHWRAEVESTLGAFTWDELGAPAGTRTRRTEHFAVLYDRITEVFRLDPTATW